MIVLNNYNFVIIYNNPIQLNVYKNYRKKKYGTPKLMENWA